MKILDWFWNKLVELLWWRAFSKEIRAKMKSPTKQV